MNLFQTTLININASELYTDNNKITSITAFNTDKLNFKCITKVHTRALRIC